MFCDNMVIRTTIQERERGGGSGLEKYSKALATSTYHGTIFKWCRELQYRYNGIVWVFIWDPNKAIGIWGLWSVKEVLLCTFSRTLTFWTTP